MAEILNGIKLSEALNRQTFLKASACKERGINPSLAAVSVGKDESSEIYIETQKKLAASLGIGFSLVALDQQIGQVGLISAIESLNKDKSITSIILQRPLPSCFNYLKLTSSIEVTKDAEAIHPENLGRILLGNIDFVPPTVAAVKHLIDFTKVNLYGKEVVIVGHSQTVGLPLALVLLNKFATVTVTHIATFQRNLLKTHTASAEVLVVAAGKPGLITAQDVKPASIVIDVGINKVAGKIVGDVDFDGVKDKVSFISPVPGGVGQVTSAFLMRNVVALAERNLTGLRA